MQKLKNNEARPKFTGCYKKKRVCTISRLNKLVCWADELTHNFDPLNVFIAHAFQNDLYMRADVSTWNELRSCAPELNSMHSMKMCSGSVLQLF